MGLFSVNSKTPFTINFEDLSPENLADAIKISSSLTTPRWFSSYSGTIKLERTVEADKLRFWFEWEVPATDELASSLPEKEKKEYEEWKLAQASKPTDDSPIYEE